MFTPVTLRRMLQEKVDVLVYCRCQHSAIIKTELLIEKLGPDYQIPRVADRMKCSACGSKEVHTRPAYDCKISNNMVPGPSKVPE